MRGKGDGGEEKYNISETVLLGKKKKKKSNQALGLKIYLSATLLNYVLVIKTTYLS